MAMNYLEKLENVTVLGAAGKMGRGILLLAAIEMLNQKLKPQNSKRQFVLYAMDVNNQLLNELMGFIKSQALKYAEKNIVSLRKQYQHRKDLIDNEDVIREYVLNIVELIRPGTRVEPAFDSRIVFEAVHERPDLKVDLMLTINRNSKLLPWFFSNTSSIPVNWLDEQAGLEGRIMGLHFYNPPQEQKLVEVIKTDTTNPELSYFVAEFVKNTGKMAVPAYDVAGFIGNGYFVRDILFAESLIDDLLPKFSFSQALYMVNKVSRDYLLRPQGVFELVDKTGIDRVQFIMAAMNSYISGENLQSSLIDKMLVTGNHGGQNPDSTPKDGFFQYKKGIITGVFDMGKKRYLDINEVAETSDEYLGALPVSWKPWKEIIRHPHKGSLLSVYFDELKGKSNPGAVMARDYLQKYRDIAMGLVKNKVAFRFDDVNAVVIHGFQNAYGPVSSYF
ncbi:MAG: 3-hydroxyacyl-CoA dehydrogenase family protein [bacterium]